MILKHHFDNESNLKKFGKPVFLAHGTRDGIVPFAMSQKLADAAAAGGAKVIKYDVPGGDHNDIYDIGGDALLDAITQFVDAHAANAAGRGQAEGLRIERR